MSKEIAPAFQFYAAEYLADENVVMMSVEEEGCYIRLMAYCWREGSIPHDAVLQAKLCKGITPSKLVIGCFDYPSKDETRLLHPRLEIERKKKAKWKKECAKGGRNSAHKRKHKKEKRREQSPSSDPSRSLQGHCNTSSSTSSSNNKENTNVFSSVRSDSKSESSGQKHSPLISFPLVDKTEFHLAKADISELSKLYPGVDPEKELLRAKGWLLANPTRRKTRRGIGRFVHNWLSRAQDSGKTKAVNRRQSTDLSTFEFTDDGNE